MTTRNANNLHRRILGLWSLLCSSFSLKGLLHLLLAQSKCGNPNETYGKAHEVGSHAISGLRVTSKGLP